MAKDAVPVGDVRISILAHKIFDSGCYWEKRKNEQKLMEELVVRLVASLCLSQRYVREGKSVVHTESFETPG